MPAPSNILNSLRTFGEQSFPILNKNIPSYQLPRLDLSIHNDDLNKVLDREYDNLLSYSLALEQYIDLSISARKVPGIGGYLEHRHLYQKSPHFLPGQLDERTIHLGIDIWDSENTPIYSVLEGTIHSINYNNKVLDYGGTIITRHQSEDNIFHCLYGHLSKSSLKNKEKGQLIDQGAQLGTLGNRKENGGWPSHLHFQIILDMEGWEGDYPGVAAFSNIHHYQKNCPDPTVLLKSV